MKKFLFLLVLMFFSRQVFASSRFFLEITRNLQQKAEIVILLEFERDAYRGTLLDTLARDLEYSGFFEVEASLFVEDVTGTSRNYPVPLILSGRETEGGIDIKVFDPLDEIELFRRSYSWMDSPSMLAHKINDDIVFHLTGRPGIASSKIVFVSDATGSYELYSVDYDGENLLRLTESAYMVHYPRWASFYDELIYVSYRGGWPKIMKKNISTGDSVMLLGEPGLNACASISPAAEEMAVVLSRTGRPEIYITGLDGKIKSRLTYGNTTEASPSFSPCGTRITFVSDRHGSPQVYTMTREGFRVERISYVAGYSTSPTWSPDGRYIAYVFLRGGNFGLALYDVEERETRVINERLGSEEISWAPDSRHLVYSDIGVKPSRVMIIDVMTGAVRALSGGGGWNSFSPSWHSH